MALGERNNGLNLDEEDRLPWLEPAGIEEEAEPVSLLRIIGLAALGLLLLAVIVAGGYWLKNRDSGHSGDAPLIAAQSESYKIPANDADARAFEGEDDAAFAASEGQEASGRIDASRVPEAPRTDLRPAVEGPTAPAIRTEPARPTVSAPVRPAQTSAPARVVSRPAPAATPADAAADTPAAASAATPSGPRIQLGAFGSRAIAQDVWKKHVARFDYIAPLKHSVEPVETGGRTLYRLRAGVASQADATQICGRLRVAGENCMVVR